MPSVKLQRTPAQSRLRAISWSVCCMAAMACSLPSFAADILESIPAINDTADRICATIATNGSSRQVKTQVDGLFTRLGEAGVNVKADLKTSTYQGVSQPDLVRALKDQRDCKFQVFNKLVVTLSPPTGTVEANFSGYTPTGHFETEFRYFVEVSGFRATYAQLQESLLRNMEAQFLQQYPNDPNVHSFVQTVRQEMPRLDDLVDLMLPLYRKHFTVREVQELNKFYSTASMRNLASKMPQLAQEAAPVIMQVMQESQARVARRLSTPTSPR